MLSCHCLQVLSFFLSLQYQQIVWKLDSWLTFLHHVPCCFTVLESNNQIIYWHSQFPFQIIEIGYGLSSCCIQIFGSGTNWIAEWVTFSLPVTNVLSFAFLATWKWMEVGKRFRWFVVCLQQKSTQVSVSPTTVSVQNLDPEAGFNCKRDWNNSISLPTEVS